jgi:Bacterial transcriptional activator domain
MSGGCAGRSDPRPAARIAARNPGYLVRVKPEELDVLKFEASCAEASAALRERAWAAASAAAARALALWRGAPLLDVASQAAGRYAVRASGES